MKKTQILSTLKVILTFIGVFFIFCVFKSKYSDIKELFVKCDIKVVFYAIFVYLAASGIVALRLNSILLMQNVKIPLLYIWRLNYIGYFLNMFMPSSIGGDIGKAYYAYKYTNKLSECIMAVFIDRLIGYMSIITLCVFALFFMHKEISNPIIPAIIIVFFIISILMVLFFINDKLAAKFSFLKRYVRSDKIIRIIKRMYYIAHECKNHKKLFIKAYTYSIAFQMLSILSVFVIGLSINITISIMNYFMLLPLIFIFSMLPSINGIGVREGAFIYFFSLVVSADEAFTLSILFDIIIYTASIVGIYAYITNKSKNKLCDIKEMTSVIKST